MQGSRTVTSGDATDVTHKQKIKASTIHDYNMNMKGCDKADQMTDIVDCILGKATNGKKNVLLSDGNLYN